MTGDNVFEGLNEQLEAVEQGNGADESDDEPDAEPAATDADDESATEPDADATTAPEPESDEPDDESGPAFDFDNDMQQSIYIRDETWSDFEDTVDFEIKRILREKGTKEVTGREIHDAVLRMATEDPERVAELFLELREDIRGD